MALFESELGENGNVSQTSKFLYNHSAEFSLFVLPSSKGIEVKIPACHFEEFVAYLAKIFKNPKITDEGYSAAKCALESTVQDLSVKNKYNMLAKTYEVFFDDQLFSLPPQRSCKVADKEAAQTFVTRAFDFNEPLYHCRSWRCRLKKNHFHLKSLFK